MKISDQEIWLNVKKSDIKAFEALYVRHFPSLCLYAYGLVHDEELAKEIVNDVFLKIWNKRECIDIKHLVKPYLYKCVHNSCIDYRKMKYSHIQNASNDISLRLEELTVQDSEYILNKISHGDLEKNVMKSISNLPPKCREVFILSRFDLLSYTEISKKLSISVNTIKTQISRALDRLRIELKEYL